MKAGLLNWARVWGTGLVILWSTLLALGIVCAPAWCLLWSLRWLHVSPDATGWIVLAYCLMGAPLLTYYVSRLFGLRVRKIPVA